MTAKLYTPKEVGDMLGLSALTVRRRIKAGEIASINVGTAGRTKNRISAEALDDYLKARTNVA